MQPPQFSLNPPACLIKVGRIFRIRQRRPGASAAVARRARFRSRHGARRRLVSFRPRGPATHRQDRDGGADAGHDHLQRTGLLRRRQIRHPHREFLIVVETRAIRGAERAMLGFETISSAPIDLRLVEPEPWIGEEIAWLDGYHARVREVLVAAGSPADAGVAEAGDAAGGVRGGNYISGDSMIGHGRDKPGHDGGDIFGRRRQPRNFLIWGSVPPWKDRGR